MLKTFSLFLSFSLFLFFSNVALASPIEQVRKYFKTTDWKRFKKHFGDNLKYRGFIPVKKYSTKCRLGSIFYIDTGEIEFDFKESPEIEEAEYGKYMTPINKVRKPEPTFLGWGKGSYVGGQLGNPILFYSFSSSGKIKYLGHLYTREFQLQNINKAACPPKLWK